VGGVADRVTETLKTIQAPEVLVGGKLLAEHTFAEQAAEDAVFGESIALVVLAAVLVLFLGGPVAGLLPLAAALATIAGSLLVLNALAGVVAVSASSRSTWSRCSGSASLWTTACSWSRG
jgi:RND superfamily putative drug exporter